MSLHASAERFWDWYAVNSDRLRENLLKDAQRTGDEIGYQFRKAYPQLSWEIGPASKDAADQDWEFCISAEGNIDLFPAVERAVTEAPPIPGWKVVAFRQRGKLEDVQLQFGNDLTFGSDDVWWTAEEIDAGLSVNLWIRGLDPATDEVYSHAALILLDHALGEYDSTTVLAELNRGPLPDDPESYPDLHPLIELPTFVDNWKSTSGRS